MSCGQNKVETKGGSSSFNDCSFVVGTSMNRSHSDSGNGYRFIADNGDDYDCKHIRIGSS